MAGADWARHTHAHYREIWGVDGDLCRLPDGPTHQLPGFEVRKFPPTADQVLWTYATCGMSQPGDSEPLELHIHGREESTRLVLLLTVVAHYHRTGQRLGLGHTVNFGLAWQPGSSCDRGLISLPYLYGPRLENLTVDGVAGKCLWLIPVTTAEVEFKKSNGLDALEERFEGDGFDYADPLRPSVA
ncbi:MAG TPA: suppressor of fused domain protein [Caulobacter sp.]|nr:suppressor of fused domain protein [Caulobacter sp.]